MDEAETTSQARARTWSSEADKGYDRTKAKAHPQAEHWTREILQLFKHIAWCASAEYRYRSERSHELNAKSEKKKKSDHEHTGLHVSQSCTHCATLRYCPCPMYHTAAQGTIPDLTKTSNPTPTQNEGQLHTDYHTSTRLIRKNKNACIYVDRSFKKNVSVIVSRNVQIGWVR